ncbi:hypothetical protein [Streptomyces hypolithicus]
MDEKPEQEAEEPKRPRIDLSVAQVSGSAVAAIVAAVLASKLGVYGTVIGAGVVSVVATSGGTLFQHVFRRTGEQIREVTVHAKPRGRQVPARPVQETEGATRTRVLRTVAVPTDLSNEEFGEATTHRTRARAWKRGWKRSAIAAGVVFAVAMGGITTYELASGADLSGSSGSTVGNVLRGGGGGGGGEQKPSSPSQAPGESPGGDSVTPPGSGTNGEQSPGEGSEDSPRTGAGSGGAVSPEPGDTPPPTDGGGSTPEATPTPPPTPTPKPSGSAGGDSPASGGDADGEGAEGESPAP